MLLYNVIRGYMLGMICNEMSVYVIVQVKVVGIDLLEKLQGVIVQDGKVFVIGIVFGFCIVVDMIQMVLSLQEISVVMLVKYEFLQ